MSIRLVLITGLMASCVAVSSFAICPAAAQSTGGPSDPAAASALPDAAALNRDTLTIAIGAGIGPSYEGSKQYVVIPGAVVRGRYKGINFQTRGTSLVIDVVPSSGGPGWKLDAGPVANLDLNRTGRVHPYSVRALGRRKAAVELGGFAGITRTGVITSEYDSLTARVAYVGDVSGVNHGYLLSPTIEYGTPLSRKAFVGLSVTADYASSGYAHTYYDVPLSRVAASGLTPFSARGGWKDYSINALGDYAVTGDLLHGISVFTTASYARLQNDFARSPIVSQIGSRTQLYGAVGVAYTF